MQGHPKTWHLPSDVLFSRRMSNIHVSQGLSWSDVSRFHGQNEYLSVLGVAGVAVYGHSVHSSIPSHEKRDLHTMIKS
jgi:hypothetical protein